MYMKYEHVGNTLRNNDVQFSENSEEMYYENKTEDVIGGTTKIYLSREP